MLRDLLERLANRGRNAPQAPAASLPSAPSPADAAESAERAADRLIVQGNQAEDAGRPDAACACYRDAVASAPGYAKAHLNLGIGLEATGDRAGAVAAFGAALACDAGEPYANYNLGRLKFEDGALREAEAHLRGALERKPGFGEALMMLSAVLQAKGEPELALEALQSAQRVWPENFGVWYHQGLLLKRLERGDAAETAFRRALALEPANPDASFELGTLLMARGAMLEAGEWLQAAATRRPDAKEIRAALYHFYDAQGDSERAIGELASALSVFPEWVDAIYNYGLLLKKAQRLDEAEAAFRRALSVDPAYFRAAHMLGSALLGQGRVADALEAYRLARTQHPESFELESAELFALNCHDGVSAEALFAAHRVFGERIEKHYLPRFEPLANVADRGRRLRVGYVSGDFCYHVVTLFLQPVLERHDRSAFEIYCYATGERNDQFTRRLAAHADVWRDASLLSARELADLVHSDGIDILIDLGGHSGVPNLSVFAQRPAPVQATWLGYLNSTGMTRMHYRITDAVADPAGVAEAHHTETLVRLPHAQWCYRPFLQAPLAGNPFVRNGYLTFGSFNQAAKLSASAQTLWAELLLRVPDARLVIVGVPGQAARDALVANFGRRGIAPERVAVRPFVALDAYYRAFDEVDVALDTLPYSGGTTTCDALWMGVPVLTLPGKRPSSRSAASVLSATGLGDWIADNPEHFIRLGSEFASRTEGLVGFRTELRERMRESPLMDEIDFTRGLESAYRRMWQTWCKEPR